MRLSLPMFSLLPGFEVLGAVAVNREQLGDACEEGSLKTMGSVRDSCVRTQRNQQPVCVARIG